MSDLSKNNHPREEIKPILLGMKSDEAKDAHRDSDSDEQEALWNRSLEFFQTMNVTTRNNP